MKKKNILAIGCGGAGMFSLVVASQLKKGQFTTKVLSDEENIYCRCTSTYVLSGDATLDDAIQPDSMVGDYGVEIIHEKAVAISTVKKQVTTNKGNVYPYDYLVIATGARPARPPIPGIDLPHVYSVRTSEDVRRIQNNAKKAKRVAVIGSGVIGIEMAGVLKHPGVDVNLIEYAPSITPRIADKEYADKLVGHLKDNGIITHFGTKLVEIKEHEGALELHLEENGEKKTMIVDMVILAAGVTPNTEIVKGTGIRTSPRGIIVDSRMRTSAPGIYACGDCAMVESAITGAYEQSALASLAIQQSKIVGFQIAGFPIRYNGSTNAFAFKVMGKEYAASGLTEEMARKRYRWVIVGRAVTTDLYNDLKAKQPLEVKLIFAGPKMRLVGYEAFGNGVIASAEVASFAMGLRLSILGMLKFNYISHPSLTPWPFMNPIIMATEDAMGAMMKSIKTFFGVKAV